MNDQRKRPLALVFFLVVCLGVAATASIATRPEIPTWYAALNKPSWNPPPWLFGPVWTTLYIMMAVAAWLVVREKGWAGARGPMSLFFAQLILNFSWSFVFFGWHRPDLAFLNILLLWGAIGVTAASFWHVRPLAGKLLAPYWLWVSFAAFLNFTLWRMNPI